MKMPLSPMRILLGFLALHLVLWTLQPILTAPNIRLDTAEIAVMGREWAWSYHNHPPIPAILGNLIHRAAGPTYAAAAFALACQVLVVSAFYLVWRVAREILSPTGALLAVLPLGAAGYYTWITREWNHALVLLPLVALAVFACHRALRTGRTRYWLLLGASLGLGLLCKYSMGLLALSIALFILLNPRARATLRTAGPYVGAVTAVVVVLPHFVWLLQHDFPTLQYIARRSETATSHGFWLQTLSFVGGQFAYLGLFFAPALAALSLPAKSRAFNPDERQTRDFLFAITLGPSVLLLVSSLISGRPLITAWAMPFWLFTGVLILFSCKPSAKTEGVLVVCAVAIAINFVVALLADTVWPCMRERASRAHFPGRALAEKVEAQWTQRFGSPLPAVAGERWLADNVAFYAGSRPRTLTYDRDLIAYSVAKRNEVFRRGGVLVWDISATGPELPDFLRREYSGATVAESFELPWQTYCDLAPARFGLAIIEPATVEKAKTSND